MDGEARELKRYTDEEFYEYLENNDTRAELIGGFIFVAMGQPSPFHQTASLMLTMAVYNYIQRNKKNCRIFQELEVRFDESNIVVPDIMVTCKPGNVDKKRMNGAPEFVLEIVSSNSANDYFRKLTLYKNFGVREYWIVDPRTEHVTVWFFEDEESPTIYNFSDDITVRMTEDEGEGEPLVLNIAALIENAY